MGLLDGLAGQVLGGMLGGGTQGGEGSQDAAQLVQLVMSLIQNQGGLGALLQQFQRAGLGEQAASWVGTGENLPISADQLSAALGSGALGDIAGRLGLSHGDAAGLLTGVLPQLVDKLTPDGQITEQHDSLAGLAALAGKLLG